MSGVNVVEVLERVRGVTDFNEYLSRLGGAERFVLKLSADGRRIVAVRRDLSEVSHLFTYSFGEYRAVGDVCGDMFFVVDPKVEKADPDTLYAVMNVLGVERSRISVEMVTYRIFSAEPKACRYDGFYSHVLDVEIKPEVYEARVLRITVWHRTKRAADEMGARLAHAELVSRTRMPWQFRKLESSPYRCYYASVLEVVIDASQLSRLFASEEELMKEAVEEGEEIPSEVAEKIAREVEKSASEELELELEESKPATPAVQTQPQPSTAGLVKLYILRWVRPSKYLVQRLRFEKAGEGIVEVRDFSEKLRAAVASALNGLRSKTRNIVRKYFVHLGDERSPGLWIAFSDEALRVAEEAASVIRKRLGEMPALAKLRPDYDRLLARYVVRVIPVYVEPETALEILYEARHLLESEVEKLRERIERARNEKNRSYLRSLEEDYNYRYSLLQTVRKMIEELEKKIKPTT